MRRAEPAPPQVAPSAREARAPASAPLHLHPINCCTLQAFCDSLVWWPCNGMAMLNLADLEREHGSVDSALGLFQKATSGSQP